MALAQENDAEITPETVKEVAEVSEARALDELAAARERAEAWAAEMNRTSFSESATPSAGTSGVVLAQLDMERARAEAELHEMMWRAGDMESQGLGGSSIHEEALRNIDRQRANIAALSAEIQARRQRADWRLATQDAPTPELVARVRRLLIKGQTESPATGTDWENLTLAEIRTLIVHADALDPKFREIVTVARKEIDRAWVRHQERATGEHAGQ